MAKVNPQKLRKSAKNSLFEEAILEMLNQLESTLKAFDVLLELPLAEEHKSEVLRVLDQFFALSDSCISLVKGVIYE